MKTDTPLKVLFQTRPQDLLPIIGETGARVLSAGVIELPSIARRVDMVLSLGRGRRRYLHHMEFQDYHRGPVAFRCFEYATRLVARFRLPVVTTVVYVRLPAPKRLSWVERVGGRVVNERHFEVVHLWELPAERVMALGPGGAALVPLLPEPNLRLIGEASRRICREAPAAQQPDLLGVLHCLSLGRYTAEELARLIPEEVAMQSSLFAKVAAKSRAEGLVKGRAEGRVEGRAEGRAEGVQRVCLTVARHHHPALAARLLPAIRACSDVRRLNMWVLRAPELSDAEFERLVTGGGGAARNIERRAPRPASRSTARRRTARK